MLPFLVTSFREQEGILSIWPASAKLLISFEMYRLLIIIRKSDVTEESANGSDKLFANSLSAGRLVQLSGRFFKIVVWTNEEGLRPLGMMSDQRPIFGPSPEALLGSKSIDLIGVPEAYQHEAELEPVDHFSND